MPPPDETDRLTAAFARRHNQARIDGLSRTLRAATDADGGLRGSRASGRAPKRKNGPRCFGPKSRAHATGWADLLQPTERYPLCRPANGHQQATSPIPVRAQVVSEHFKGRDVVGTLATFPPVVRSRPERVQVAFNFDNTPTARPMPSGAYAIDTESARTALATGVDHHTWNAGAPCWRRVFWKATARPSVTATASRRSLHSAASSPCRRTGSITATSRARPFGDRRAADERGGGRERPAAQYHHRRRRDGHRRADGRAGGIPPDTGEPSPATAASPTPRTAPPDRWPPASDPVRPSASPSASR